MTAAIALGGQFARDALREGILASVLLFVAGAGFVAPLVSGLAMGGPDKALRDLGLGLFWLVGSAAAIWLGVRGIGADLHDGTAALWLHRPVSRAAWVGGRFAGVLAVLVAEVVFLLASWMVIAAWYDLGFGASLLGYAVLLWFELALVAAWGMLFSALTGPVPAGMLTAALWAAGHLADEYTRLGAGDGHPIVAVLSRVLFVVVPDLDLFDVQGRVVHGLALDPRAALAACAYGAAWTAGLVVITALLVARRDVA
jgi:Cu-processing system permease protein